MGKRIKIGMTGSGLNSWTHILELKFIPKIKRKAECQVIFEPNQNNQKKRIGMKDITFVNSFDDLLNTPGLNAIMVNSPPQFHADQVVAALESGLHVYSEVPMAIKKKDINRIIDAEDKSGKFYQLGENYCFFSEVLYAGYLISSGKIGPAVYAESEYLHDVSYRWRENSVGGPKNEQNDKGVESWYSLMEPMMYAHTIGPAQVALGGIETPSPFIEVKSYINSVGGYKGDPICRPMGSFQVALFKTESDAIAKCANAYVFAREPNRLIIQITGRTGTYECYNIGQKGRLFVADGHIINKMRHRKGKAKKIGHYTISKVIPRRFGFYHGAGVRVLDNWLSAIEKNTRPALHAKIAANMCMAGIAAAESAHSNKTVSIPIFTSKK
ncbi:MAG: Gfo/Idh/MocA family oxidoreductase [archaeon]|nr:Gfo/Idh/MocA family oxidoreductase [archaeon]